MSRRLGTTGPWSFARSFWLRLCSPNSLNPEWLRWSRDELVKNIQSDLQPDGVHSEQSTDYHHLVLKNYLWINKLARLNQIEMPEKFDQLIRKALEFSLYSHRPDGLIPALSDGDSRCFLDLLQQGYDLYGGRSLVHRVARRKGHAPTVRSKDFPIAAIMYCEAAGVTRMNPMRTNAI